MIDIVDRPLLIFALSFVAFCVSALVGGYVRKRGQPLGEDQRRDIDVVQTAALTLLGLLIGFTFSMALTRYDQRKGYEEAEANAIGTEYVRADLLLPADTARVQELLTPVNALAISGMNDVLNSQGYTQAAWWNRIPLEAWGLLALIAMGCNLLIGYSAHRTSILFVVLPLAVSLSFFLIADIDSPRGGLIRVQPENLVSLSQTLR
jgi:hypothetical protein